MESELAAGEIALFWSHLFIKDGLFRRAPMNYPTAGGSGADSAQVEGGAAEESDVSERGSGTPISELSWESPIVPF